MSNASQVKFKTENFTQTVGLPLDGISFVLGKSVRGPFADPKDIINSWPKFVEIYGGLSDVSDAPLLARRILEKGGSLRFSRVGHYTNPADASTLDAIKGTPSPVILYEIDGPFVTGNLIDLTINGDSIPTVSFVTDSDTTFNNLAIAVKALPAVKDAIIIEEAVGVNTMMFIVPEVGVTMILTASTITGGTTQPLDTQSNITTIVDSNGNNLFSLALKNPGEDGNNINVSITAASNGSPNYFKLTISHITENTSEVYDNLTITGLKTAAESTYLKSVVEGSSIVDVVYNNHTAFSGQLVPLIGLSYSYIGGDDGGVIADADYIGDSAARNGLHAFDDYDDALEMVALDNDSDAVNIAGASYAANRGDLIYMVHLPIALKSKTALIAKRDSLNINTKYAYIVSGGIRIFDPITGKQVGKSEMGDVIAIASRSAQENGAWFSFAGLRRGLINGVLGVVNNFGTPAVFSDLNDLANKQINMVITKNNQSVLWGNHSAQLANDQEKFINVVRLVIFMKKALKPTLESFLEEPNDIATWKRIFYTVRPFLESLVDRRAIFSYEWVGDQDASDFNSLQVNNAADVSDGKYKVKLVIGAIPGLNEIEVSILLTRAGVSFSEVSDLS